jgi:predicted transcriptional regulator YheO
MKHGELSASKVNEITNVNAIETLQHKLQLLNQFIIRHLYSTNEDFSCLQLTEERDEIEDIYTQIKDAIQKSANWERESNRMKPEIIEIITDLYETNTFYVRVLNELPNVINTTEGLRQSRALMNTLMNIRLP